MPRVPRYFILSDDSEFHLTWQCHNKSWFLRTEWAKRLYYDLLLKHKDAYGVTFYSYCFMSSHPHLTGHCQTRRGLSDLMRLVNSIFAQTINTTYGRFGQAIRDRFKSPQIQDDEHLFRVMTYIDLNPVRARIVKHPRRFKWTSFHFYAYGKKDPLIEPAPAYLKLAPTPEERQQKYLEHVEDYLTEEGVGKRNYSCVCAIGNPEWVLLRQELIRAYFRSYWERRREARSGFQ